MIYSNNTLIILCLVFIFAGFVKGIIGLGFPTIVLASLSLAIGLRDSMAIMLLPCFLTNVYQGSIGGSFQKIIRRLWSYFALAICGIWVTTGFVAGIQGEIRLILLGTIVFTYGILGITRVKLMVPRSMEWWLSPVLGSVNGILTGLTGTFVVPGVLYMQSLGLQKDELIQAMGIFFLLSTLGLGAGLWENQLTSTRIILLSGVAVIPSFIGMVCGQKVRSYLPEMSFRYVFFFSLILLGCFIMYRQIS